MADYITAAPNIALAFCSPEHRTGHPLEIVGFDLSGKTPTPVFFPALPKSARVFRQITGGWREYDATTGLFIGTETLTGPKWEA